MVLPGTLWIYIYDSKTMPDRQANEGQTEMNRLPMFIRFGPSVPCIGIGIGIGDGDEFPAEDHIRVVRRVKARWPSPLTARSARPGSPPRSAPRCR